MKNLPRLSYCIRIEVYTRTEHKDSLSSLLKTNAKKGIGQYFPTTLHVQIQSEKLLEKLLINSLI